jgi:hypothetical protein
MLRESLKSYINLTIVAYACKIWLPTLREEHRLKVYENRVLRRMFGPKRERTSNRRMMNIT